MFTPEERVNWSPDGLCPVCGHAIDEESNEVEFPYDGDFLMLTVIEQSCPECGWFSDQRVED